MSVSSPSSLPAESLRDARPPGRARIAFALVVVLSGVGAGLGGMALALLLHGIQHLAYGYSAAHLISDESFLQGVTGTTPLRRVLVLIGCGLIAGGGWWALYRFGRPLVGIRRAVASDDPRLPPASTTIHALLQIVTVALGSPLGREVAPREIGALWAGWLAWRAGLSLDDRRILVACGAGAGLAAVYNVPLGGAVFVLEVLIGSFGWRALAPAFATSALAALVAWIGLGNEHQYRVPALALTPSLVVWAAVCGPLFGAAAWGFARLAERARGAAPKDWRLPVFALANFACIGVLAIGFPQLLGNGKGPAGLSFDGGLGIGLAAALFVLRVAITVSSLRVGAEGGLLTPGIANGALLAIVLGGLWSLAWPGTALGAYALVGAAAFLAASMRMPLTAVVLMLEFTRVDHDFLFPILLAVVGAVVTADAIARRAAR